MRKLGFALAVISSALLVACGGGGGGGSTAVVPAPTPVAMQSLVTVSPSISANTYPTSYTTAANVPVVNDNCIYTETAVQYQPTDVATTLLPTIQAGASLKGLATLSVSPMDFYFVPNPGSIVNPVLDNTCGNMDMRQAFSNTLLRAKALGAKTLTMYDTRRVDDAANFVSLTSQFIPDAELRWMATQAQAQGMKLRYKIQIDMLDYAFGGTNGKWINTYLATLTQQQTAAWLTTLYTQYAIELKHMAGVMNENPTAYDAIEIDWGYFNIADWNPYNAGRFAALTQLADDIRAIDMIDGQQDWKQWVTAGTIQAVPAMDSLATGAQALVNKVDIIEAMPISTRTTTTLENASLTVSLIKGISDSYLPTWMKTVNKPFMWTLQVQSQNKYFSGVFFDGNCDATTSGDFGAQAVGYEAFLEIIRDYSTTGINGTTLLLDSINTTGYAWADTMMPHQGANVCARLQQSIRNKPAEAIVYSWFK